MSNEEQNTEQKASFETKIEEANKLLQELINPEITLSKSVEVYKQGMQQLEEAQKLLDEAKLEFQEIQS